MAPGVVQNPKQQKMFLKNGEIFLFYLSLFVSPSYRAVTQNLEESLSAKGLLHKTWSNLSISEELLSLCLLH